MLRSLVILSTFLLSMTLLMAREQLSLNRNWDFNYGWDVRHEKTLRVHLPHTWNQDALAGKEDYYRGLGHYTRTLHVPEAWRGKELYLRFKGANTIANVFLNGKHLREHRGGYTTFTVNITKAVKYGQNNEIFVRVNNAPQLDVMPLLGDFNMYGGLYRDVDLLILDPIHLSLDDHGSSGIYISQETSAERSQLHARILAHAPDPAPATGKDSATGKAPAPVQARLSLYDAQGQLVTQASSELREGRAQISLSLDKPRLWQGVSDPYLYRAQIELLHEGRVTDSLSEHIGLRWVALDPDKGFLLNGKPYQLRGVCRHQDRAEIGNALHPLHHEEDMAIMREMGVNAIRLAHYPQDKYIYELCDRYGMVVWAEMLV